MKHATVKNPVEKFVERRASYSHPIPLKSTAYEIDIVSGLAAVKLVRKFRNDEDRPIEATLTFPVPFEAAVYRIEAKIGERVLSGQAKAKADARETYEDAIDRGKAAVLHEELLRGLHMVSVANVAPRTEIEVTAEFAVPLALSSGTGRLRIPVTVGQIYGTSPLVESDDIMTGGPVMKAEVSVSCSKGTVLVNGSVAAGKAALVPLDRPISVEVAGLYRGNPETVTGRAADGKAVSLQFSPVEGTDADLDMDILLDVSGSMKERIEANPEGLGTKWDAVVAGLKTAADSVLTNRDNVTVWTFSSTCTRHGTVPGDRLRAFAEGIPFLSGGTELASAVASVVASRSEATVLLVTDGKSWSKLDVQAAVASGARFTVVLVGEDALESSVGYLASMTGGRMFVVSGSDVHGAVTDAVASMRHVGSPVTPLKGKPKEITAALAGANVTAKWSKADGNAPERYGIAVAAAAYAANLAIRGMDERSAAKFAESEGLVTHLTSIVLVDEAREAVEGIPAARKIPLASPATSGMHAQAYSASFALADSAPLLASGAMRSFGRLDFGPAIGSWNDAQLHPVARDPFPGMKTIMTDPLPFPGDGTSVPGSMDLGRDDFLIEATPGDIRVMIGKVNWDECPERLSNGEIDALPLIVKAGVLALANAKPVQVLADSLGKTAAAIVIALLAEADSGHSRTAGRIARAVLGRAEKNLVDMARKAVGL